MSNLSSQRSGLPKFNLDRHLKTSTKNIRSRFGSGSFYAGVKANKTTHTAGNVSVPTFSPPGPCPVATLTFSGAVVRTMVSIVEYQDLL